MPTPGIAYLTRTFHARAGIVISASHNPYQDNGIKFFSAEGTKLPDDVEMAIEEQLNEPMTIVESSKLGKAKRIDDAGGRYIEFCKSTVPSNLNLKGIKIVVDCANGATYHVAPSVFRELGAEVIAIGVAPDGLNINYDCGSTYPEALQHYVVNSEADIGFAFDGDGDRLIAIDHNGEAVDGDELLYIIAKHQLKTRGGCSGVVGTLMSNLGFELALAELDIPFVRAKVGDRYVMAEMTERGWELGGESSGHIVCYDLTTTGDGIISALQILHARAVSGLSLAELRGGMKKFPQTMINVKMNRRINLDQSVEVQNKIKEVESILQTKGRILLRPSGTEPVIRVMIEGEDGDLVARLTAELAFVVEKALA
jgi:phosphoglucosamine mutase